MALPEAGRDLPPPRRLTPGAVARTQRAVALLPITLLSVVLLSSCDDADAPLPPPSSPAEARFRTSCAICHGYRGEGSGERGIPTLVGSEFVRGSETRLVRLVLHGLEGPVDVGGKTLTLAMPGVGESLADEDIAALLTFVRERFGARSPPIDASTVGGVRVEHAGRERYWTAEELRQTP